MKFEVDGIQYRTPDFIGGTIFRRPILDFIESPNEEIDPPPHGIITARLREDGPHTDAVEYFMKQSGSTYGFDYDVEMMDW